MFVVPLKTSISTSQEKLERKVTQLDKFYKKGRNIHNAKSIKAKEQEIEFVENEIKAISEIFINKDKFLEKVFVDTNDVQIVDEALWKKIYLKKRAEIEELLEINGIVSDMKKLSFRTWRGKLPVREEIDIQQKRFCIQKEIIDIVIASQSINQLRRLRFNDKPVSPISLANPNYNAIPFSLEFDIEHTSLFNFIRLFLNSKLIFGIETIKINFSKEIKQSSSSENFIFDNVKINAYTVDFISDNL